MQRSRPRGSRPRQAGATWTLSQASWPTPKISESWRRTQCGTSGIPFDGALTPSAGGQSPRRAARCGRSTAGIEALLAAAHDEGLLAWALVLTLLDAGLRLGEALGLRWDRIVWRRDEDDLGRALIIDGNRPRGGALTEPKSGRTRRVALSRRLRFALAELPHALQARPRRSGLRRPGAEQLPPSGVAAHPGTSGDRPQGAEGPSGHLREPASHRGRPTRLREPTARPRGCGCDRPALRKMGRR